MVEQLLDVLLGAAVLIAAAVAVFAPRRMVASMTFLMLGLLLVFVWARLGAPDIAIAEAAIASGVTGALLVSAVTEHPGPSVTQRPRYRLGLLEAVAGLAAATVLSVAFVSALRAGAQMPRLGDSATGSVSQTSVSHPVTAVLLDFRAYDTLLEIAVLTAAAIAALALRHPADRDGRSGALHIPIDTRPVLVAFVRLVAPLVLIIAAWVLVAGSSRPGGAFQAGAMVTGALLLLVVTGHADTLSTGRWVKPAILAGLTAFLLTAAGTVALGAGWLDIEEPWGGAVTVAVETAMAVSIGVALAVLCVAAAPGRTPLTPSRELRS
ncbi:Na(+)/H(+) antiporter subunit B [Mycolicibacterium thermoresistibile]